MVYEKQQYLAFSRDAQRLAANLEQAYSFWLEARQSLQNRPASMYWAERSGHQYLYVKQSGTDNGTSLGARSPQTERQNATFTAEKKQALERAASADALIQTRSALYRRMRMPTLPDKQAEILRKLDIENLLGSPVSAVVATERGRACPLTVPDPRFMGLHKLWLADKPKRNPVKRDKGRRQGDVLLDAVRHFTQASHPINVDFLFSVPDDLRPTFDRWSAERRFIPSP